MQDLKRRLREAVFYIKSKELRPHWLSIALLLGILIVHIFVSHPLLAWISAIVILGAIALILTGTVRLARTNIQSRSASGRLDSIIENLSDGVIAYDNNFRIIVFNRASEHIFGIAESQIVGQTIGPERAGEPNLRFLVQVMFPSLAPVVVRQSDAGVYPQIIDLSFSGREIRVSTDRILDEKGRVLGFVKLIQDRTREVNLIRSKSEFITIAAHQLRTPLTAVNWIFEGFSKSNDLDESDRELAGNGLAAARKLLKIVNDLLDVSKIEEGRFGYNFRDTDIIKFLGDVLTNAQAEAKEYGIKLYFDKGGHDSLNLSIDPDKLGLSVSNLIDNAIRYNVKNGSVTIGIKSLDDKPYIQISVKDTGIGIPPEDMTKVFTKFHRSQNVLKRETEGSGLGLYITKNVINRHGGAIWAESILDRGTTFYFTLPTDPKLIPPKEIGIQI